MDATPGADCEGIMTASELFQKHLVDCDNCQSNSFKRCAQGEDLLKQICKADPVRWRNLDIPILYGEMFSPGRIKVMCDNCKELHFHGWPDANSKIEHRQSHCFGEHKLSGKYAQTGYYIVLEKGEPKKRVA
jgi:hypothetical protein